MMITLLLSAGDIFHPMTVHFPIALILVATLLAIIYLIRHRDISMSDCIRVLVILSCLGSWAAVITGNFHLTFDAEAEKVKEVHQTFAFLTSIAISFSAFVYVLSYIFKKPLLKWLYFIALLFLIIASIPFAFTCFFGCFFVYFFLL